MAKKHERVTSGLGRDPIILGVTTCVGNYLRPHPSRIQTHLSLANERVALILHHCSRRWDGVALVNLGS